MNVEIKIDSEYPVPKIIILTAEVTEEVEAAVRKLESPQTLTGCRNDLNREGVFEIIEQSDIMESLIKSRLTAWHASCLHIFRHIAPKFLDRRQPACEIFAQSDEKSDCAICAPDLISDSL